MGRPSFKPTDDQRAEVERLVKSKISIEEMARRMKLAPKTFRKYFAAQLGLIPVETVNTVLAAARPRRADTFHATPEQRYGVKILAGARISRNEIARKNGVSIEVLEEHFADELDAGPGDCKGEMLESMFFAGKGGNVAAAKVYLTFNAQGDAEADQQPSKIGLTGKKEMAAIAARTAQTGTGWEEDLGPTGKPN